MADNDAPNERPEDDAPPSEDYKGDESKQDGGGNDNGDRNGDGDNGDGKPGEGTGDEVKLYVGNLDYGEYQRFSSTLLLCKLAKYLSDFLLGSLLASC